MAPEIPIGRHLGVRSRGDGASPPPDNGGGLAVAVPHPQTMGDTMGATLADTLAARSGRVGFACAFGQWLQALEDDDREAIVECLGDRRISGAVLAAHITGRTDGVTVTGPTIRRHRSFGDGDGCRSCQRAGLLTSASA